MKTTMKRHDDLMKSGKTLFSETNLAFTRSDRWTDWSARPRLRLTGLRPVGPTVDELPTSVNQINVAC